MGPRGAKTAQNGCKCPQNDPKPRTKVPLRKATLSPCLWAFNSRLSPAGDHVTAKNKMAINWPMEAEMGPKGANSNKQHAGGLRSIS